MATLQELMAEVFGESSKEISKEASAAKTTSEEINQVLANLGLEDSETVKTAAESEKETNKGGSMKLMDIYEQIMGESTESVEQEQEKVASEEASIQEGPTTRFGELVGEYFNVMAGPYFSKVAGDLEAEAGAGHHPKGDLKDASKQEPHLPVNHKPENGKALDVTTGNSSPYSLKEKAMLKQILSRLAAGPVGNYKE